MSGSSRVKTITQIKTEKFAIGEGFSEFERYDTVKMLIEDNGVYLSEEQTIALLAKVGVIDEGADKLQWSVVYNLSTLQGKIFAHRNTDNLIEFQLEP